MTSVIILRVKFLACGKWLIKKYDGLLNGTYATSPDPLSAGWNKGIISNEASVVTALKEAREA